MVATEFCLPNGINIRVREVLARRQRFFIAGDDLQVYAIAHGSEWHWFIPAGINVNPTD